MKTPANEIDHANLKKKLGKLFMSYRINAWNQDMDSKTGEFYYSCPNCGSREGDEHSKSCQRYIRDEEMAKEREVEK